MTMPGGAGGVEVGSVSFRIGIDLTSFQADLRRAEEQARASSQRIQQQLDRLRIPQTPAPLAQPPTARQVEQAGLVHPVTGQPLLPAPILTRQPAPTPEEVAPVERIRQVKTRDYDITEAGEGPEPVHPPTPVAQRREIETRDVRTSIAPQPTPAPPAPTPVPAPLTVPARPAQAPTTSPFIQVESASGGTVAIPRRLSAPEITQRQLPATLTGGPAARAAQPPVPAGLVRQPGQPTAQPAPNVVAAPASPERLVGLGAAREIGRTIAQGIRDLLLPGGRPQAPTPPPGPPTAPVAAARPAPSPTAPAAVAPTQPPVAPAAAPIATTPRAAPVPAAAAPRAAQGGFRALTPQEQARVTTMVRQGFERDIAAAVVRGQVTPQEAVAATFGVRGAATVTDLRARLVEQAAQQQAPSSTGAAVAAATGAGLATAAGLRVAARPQLPATTAAQLGPIPAAGTSFQQAVRALPPQIPQPGLLTYAAAAAATAARGGTPPPLVPPTAAPPPPPARPPQRPPAGPPPGGPPPGGPPGGGDYGQLFRLDQPVTQARALTELLFGVGLRFGVIVTAARLLHEALAGSVQQAAELQRSTSQVGVAFGAARAPFQAAGFQQAQQAPLFAQTQASFQATAVALAPVADQLGLTDEQVRQLNTDAAQLSTIWGVTQPQAAQVLQEVMRGNVAAGQQLNINLLDQNGRIRALGASYQELASTVGPLQATQETFGEVQRVVNEQVDAFNRLATPQTKQLVELNQAWAEFETNISNIVSGPLTGFLTEVNNLLRETDRLLRGLPNPPGGAGAGGGGAPQLPAAPQQSAAPAGAAPTAQAVYGVQPTPHPEGAGLPPVEVRAAGGAANLRGAYLVGERGPELFVPQQAGYVHSAADTQRILGARQEGGPVQPGGGGEFLDPFGVRTAIGNAIRNLVLPQAIAEPQIPPEQRSEQPGRTFVESHPGIPTQIEAPLSQAVRNITATINGLSAALGALRDTARAPVPPVGVYGMAGQQLPQLPPPPGVIPPTPPRPQRAPEINLQGGVGRAPYGPLPGITPREAQVTSATLAQSVAQARVNEANARLAQTQYTSQLRALDVNRLAFRVDGQRLSAAEAINRFTAERLTLESRVVPLQLQQQQIQNRIAIITQPNLELRRQNLQAQYQALGPQAAVNQFTFERQRAQQRIQVAFLQSAAGQTPEYNVQQEMANIYRNAIDPERAKANLALTEATYQEQQTGLAVQGDQINKAMAAIPLEEQQQANERSLMMYQEQINAAQASSDAVQRVLQMADLIAAPEKLQAERDIIEAQLQAANATQQIAQSLVSRIPGSEGTPVAQNQGELPPQQVSGVQQPPPPALPPGGTPGGQQPPLPPPPVVQTAPAPVAAAPAPSPAAAPVAAAPAPQAATPQTEYTSGVGLRQAGGPVAQASQYIVGEAGPELYAPLMPPPPSPGGLFDVGNALTAMNSASPVIHNNVDMGGVQIHNEMDLDHVRQSIIDAATRGTLNALRYGRMVTPMRVPSSIAGGRGY